MRVHYKKLKISRVFPLLCFTMFAACIVMVLIMGAKLYSRSNSRNTEDYYHRTVTSYVTTRVMQSSVAGNFFVGDFDSATPDDSGDTFFFIEYFDGVAYITRLYCYDGALYELFSPADVELDPSAGERVLSLSEMSFRIEDGLLISQIKFADGKDETLRISLRTGGEEIA